MQTEQNVADVALRLQAVIDHAIDGIITISPRGIVESINKAAAEMFQYSPTEVIGQNINMLMPEPHHTNHDQYLQHYEKTGEARIIGIGREVRGKRKDGQLFPIRLSVSEVQLQNRKIYTGILHDMTEIREAEQKLISLNNELEKKVDERTSEIEDVVNRLLKTNKKLETKEKELENALAKERELSELKSRFVSMASHEFRTPLSTIKSSAALIKLYSDAEQQTNREKHLDKIQTAVNNLTGILNDFLSIGKLEEGKIMAHIQPVSLKRISSEVMDEMEGILKKGQKFDFTLKGIEEQFLSDKQIIKNIFFNLISNAIKYSGENATIYCRITQEADELDIEVEDEGIGIPEVDQKHMFDRFFRASNVESIQGTGLGLHIVKNYLDLLRGTIRFESIQGKGTTFYLRIPNGES